MSLVKVQGNASGTGIFTIAAPNSNTDRTLTLPDNTGTVLTTATPGVPVNGPAFAAYAANTQSISGATATKVLFDTEVFDTNSNFASSRFTPTVAGYYQVNWTASASSVQSRLIASLYKNGTEYFRATDNAGVGGSGQWSAAGSSLVYCNGSTDYLEVYVYFAGAANTGGNSVSTAFNGAMVRAA